MKTRWAFGILWSVASFVHGAEPGLFEVRAVANQPSASTQEYKAAGLKGEASERVLLDRADLLDGTALASATIEHAEHDGEFRIVVVLTGAGKQRFAEITTRFLDRRLGFLWEGKLLMAPIIRDPILGGNLGLIGYFTEEEAIALKTRLNAPKP